MATMLLAGALTACGGRSYVAYRAPLPPPPPAAYRVHAHRVAPAPGYVWVDGYHDWRGARYVWVPGSWMRPPHGRAVWVPGRFAPRGRGHVWIGGHWR
ncbi:MAG: YXWGXW repeat-containing protein [Bryobacterales bacterium]|nr:YXWGXW repeat-containing protein [Bryobacterales bacterium]